MADVQELLLQKLEHLQITEKETLFPAEAMHIERGSAIRRDKKSRRKQGPSKAETTETREYLEERTINLLKKRYANGEDIVADASVSDSSLQQFLETTYYQDLPKKYIKRDFDSCLTVRSSFLLRALSNILKNKGVKSGKYNFLYMRENEEAALNLVQSFCSKESFLMAILEPVQEPWLLLAQGIIPDPRQITAPTRRFFEQLSLFLDARLTSVEDIKIWFAMECSLLEIASLRYWLVFR